MVTLKYKKATYKLKLHSMVLYKKKRNKILNYDT